MVQSGDEACPLAERVACPRLHQRFEDATVDVLDRRCALAQVLQRLEGPVRLAQRDDALHRVAANVLDRGQPELNAATPLSMALSLALSPGGRGGLSVGHGEVVAGVGDGR